MFGNTVFALQIIKCNYFFRETNNNGILVMSVIIRCKLLLDTHGCNCHHSQTLSGNHPSIWYHGSFAREEELKT